MITEFLNISKQYSYKQLTFLEEIADLVIKARRGLTYSYVLGYYLKGSKAKKDFFQHLQGELESSLEKLNKRNEEDWKSYLETDDLGSN